MEKYVYYRTRQAKYLNSGNFTIDKTLIDSISKKLPWKRVAFINNNDKEQIVGWLSVLTCKKIFKAVVNENTRPYVLINESILECVNK